MQDFSPKNTYSSSHSRAEAITQAITNHIIQDLRPLSTIESKSFRNLLSVCDPRYNPISRKHLTETIIPKQYKKCVEELKTDLKPIKCIGLSHDLWTSCNTQSYGTFTAQYISDDWQMKCKVLQTRKLAGSHTSDVIAESFEQCVLEWGITDQIVTTDNAANEMKALEKLGWKHIPCMGHVINLALRKALSVPQANRIIGKGRSLVTFFHKSSIGNDLLKEKQKLI